MKPVPYEKAYTDRLMSELKRGVQSEKYGDMEPDIYSAEQAMSEAAEVIKQLLREINRN